MIQEKIKLPFTGDSLSVYKISCAILMLVAIVLFAFIGHKYRKKQKQKN